MFTLYAHVNYIIFINFLLRNNNELGDNNTSTFFKEK